MKFILHNYRRCPFCIRTRILLYLKGVAYEIVEEPLRQWTPWMIEWSFANNERSRVPVLRYVLDEGIEKIIPESNEMNLFIDSIDGKPEFTPARDSDAYAEMLHWWAWCADELKPVIDLYKYGENLQFDKEAHVYHSTALHALMEELESALNNKKFLIEDRLTLADIAIIPFIRQIMRTREGEFSFAPYPRIVAWANTILETDWFMNVVMKKIV